MLRMRFERERRRWSLCKLCQATGIEPANLSRIERGLIPVYPGWRRRIAEAFNMPEEALFQEVSDTERN